MGATKPEESGDYYAWGEVETKTDYSWSTYKWCNASDSTLTKYCNNSDYGNEGFTDTLTVLTPEDDIAHVNWGGSWRMPTKAEQDELRNNCTWTWYSGGTWRMPTKEECDELLNTNYCLWEYVKYKNVEGYKVTSKIAGYTNNWIFLPIAFWTSSLDDYNQECASVLAFNWSFTYSTSTYRTVGNHIRAVSK